MKGMVIFMNFKEELLGLLLNDVLWVPAFAWLIAQLLKFLIDGCMNKRFSAERLCGDGGMPSCHSATVASLAMMCGFSQGFGSATFALAMLFAIVVMHDAVGVRRETGKQAVAIIEMVAALNDYLKEKDAKIKTDKLKVFVGHTFSQVVCGAMVGVIVSVVYFFAFKGLIGLA